MANIITIKGSHDFEIFNMIREKINERGAHNILVLTDSDTFKSHWEEKNVRVELIKNINHDTIIDIEKLYKNVDTIIVSSIRMINRFYTETLNVKIINAKQLFEEFNSTVILVSEFNNLATEISNREIVHNDSTIKATRKSVKRRSLK